MSIALGDKIYLQNTEDYTIDVLESSDVTSSPDDSGYHTTSLNFNNSGHFIAVGNQEGTIKIWDMEQK